MVPFLTHAILVLIPKEGFQSDIKKSPGSVGVGDIRVLFSCNSVDELHLILRLTGIVTHGVLVDIPRLKGVPYLEPGTPIFVEDIEAWVKKAEVKIGSGDALFVRTGRWARRADKGPWNAGEILAGLHVSVVPWLKQRDVAILAGDGASDVIPSQVEGVAQQFIF